MRTGDELRAALERVFTYLGPLSLGAERNDLPRPWITVADGREWVIATEGYFLVGVHREFVPGDVYPAPTKIGESFGRWLSLERIDERTATAADWRAFAGPAYSPSVCRRCKGTTAVRCGRCGGTGRDTHTCSLCDEEHDGACPDCDSGKASCGKCADARASRDGKIASLPVNRLLLAGALAAVDEPDDALIAIGQISLTNEARTADAICVAPAGGGPWVAFLMAMRYSSAAVEFDDRKSWKAA